MRTYKVTLSHGGLAEIDHSGPVTSVIKDLRKKFAIRDNHGRMIMTAHVVTVRLSGKPRGR